MNYKIKEAVNQLFGIETVEIQETRKEFEGDITIVLFPLLPKLKKSPAEIGTKLGTYLTENYSEIDSFELVAGFLNLSLNASYYLNQFKTISAIKNFGIQQPIESEDDVMVEYSSPNTNKPLHLGHIRNNLLGYSVAKILEASGKKVHKTQIINDRGIHICKSMVAWKLFAEGKTPESENCKGDTYVGNYYVLFDKLYKEQIAELIEAGNDEKTAKEKAPILLEAQDYLRRWEQGDKEIVALWKMMNQWVYDGFEITYKKLGVDFDKNYYESDTYLLGKNIIFEGLEKGIFYKKEDGSIWVDLTAEGLDEKIVLRADGTSVYITQDIGTAIERFSDFKIDKLVYTVGNEQDYHFKVLFLILAKLGYSWAKNLYHLSYGMVDLPSGKMKSREGTVVDADDLIEKMVVTAKEKSEELGKLEGYSEEKKEALFNKIGLGAIKYFILKVDPKKRILFNPEESVDFNGNTGPFIQYTYARIQSVLRKVPKVESKGIKPLTQIHIKERSLIKMLLKYPETITEAAHNYSPALIANYTYELVKEYNSYYQSVPILAGNDESIRYFRIQLSFKVAEVIASAFQLLGIEVPERM